MIVVKHECIKSIPLLHVVKQKEQWEKLPLIIFIHGFTSAKEHNLHYAYLLAEAGFRILLPEALYHGEREQDLTEKDLLIHFWDIVLNTINEIKIIKEFYEEEGLVKSGEIGVVGTSMGGMVTLGAMTQYEWIKVAVSLMGMPAYEKYSLWQLEQLSEQGVPLPFNEEEIEQQLATIRQYDLSLQPEKLVNRPLLFWHGKKDSLVPYPLTYQFFETIKPDYQQNPGNLAFLTDEQAGHKVSREGLIATVEWFKQHLFINDKNIVGVN
ncbi:prolyl oligopeptidase family serine peptidase [Neobacillus sp. PS3-40]|uniref:prolyl oligopeptidase family serine peptidase n=1 Tax=Neobacillus sp. PS3-40 TaxID=3070679 RepID=UPI0027DF297B|nr:prolyl oligopeptidase family serine peptidase [Neobacillus sp. PS3-40]WML43355.1 prolyl oligopeptidase family serine peptidase [Neobacillus sp. PS3-40]